MPIFDRKRQGIANRCKGDGLLRLWTLLEKRMQTLNGYILSIPKAFSARFALQTKKEKGLFYGRFFIISNAKYCADY